MGIDILDSIVTKITDKTYPNIKFYLHKDEINWKAQMDNMKEVMDICVEMWKETDWDAFWAEWYPRFTLTVNKKGQIVKKLRPGSETWETDHQMRMYDRIVKIFDEASRL